MQIIASCLGSGLSLSDAFAAAAAAGPYTDLSSCCNGAFTGYPMTSSSCKRSDAIEDPLVAMQRQSTRVTAVADSFAAVSKDTASSVAQQPQAPSALSTTGSNEGKTKNMNCIQLYFTNRHFTIYLLQISM